MEEPGTLPASDLPEQESKEVQIRYSPEAPSGDPNRTIHPRFPYPTVTEGEDVPDDNPSPPVDIESPNPK
jgi:hypothetical protein